MKRIHFLPVAAALFTLVSCGQTAQSDFAQNHTDQTQGTFDTPGNTVAQIEDSQNNSFRPASEQQQSKAHQQNFAVIDQKTNLPIWSIQLPSGWSFNYSLDYTNNKDYPSADWKANDSRTGTQAQNVRSTIYTYSNDRSVLESLRLMKANIMAPISPANIQRQQVAGMMVKKGYRMTGETQSRKHEQKMMQTVAEFGLQGVQPTAIVANWEAGDGRKAQTILMYASLSKYNMTSWWYETVVMEGKGQQFEMAVQEMDNGILSVRNSPQWIQYHKNLMARNNAAAAARNNAAQQSFQAHQQRMANNQRNFEATQRAITDANDFVNSSSMSIYNTQSQSSDYIQDQFVDYMRDEQNAYNPNNGTSYKVESGYDQYYMNNNNEYIGTNNSLYDPNLDPAVNEENWNRINPY